MSFYHPNIHHCDHIKIDGTQCGSPPSATKNSASFTTDGKPSAPPAHLKNYLLLPSFPGSVGGSESASFCSTRMYLR